jgi:hypothetical protein
MYIRTLFTFIAVSVTMLGCATPDKNTPSLIKTLSQEQSSNATEICNAEARAYQPIQAVGEGAAGELLRSALKDSSLIVGGGFGGEIVRAQQKKKSQDAREKILADCLKKLGIPK